MMGTESEGWGCVEGAAEPKGHVGSGHALSHQDVWLPPQSETTAQGTRVLSRPCVSPSRCQPPHISLGQIPHPSPSGLLTGDKDSETTCPETSLTCATCTS